MVYTNSAARAAISEYIHNPRYREVLELRLCDSATYEEIAGRVGYSPQHIKAICREFLPIIREALKK